ncbi:MAG TPA: hypothetical protein VL738_31040 [Dactylosporangium sp.]|jgi:hypothetical protein|nr:hypothetical protein [Dactylosporangium sp.]
MGDVRGLRRWSATVATVAAVGVGTFAGAVALAGPAWAADIFKVTVQPERLEGKVGEKATLQFSVENISKEPATGLTVMLTTPGNATADPADNPGCEVGPGGRTVTCRSNGTLGPGKSGGGRFTMKLNRAGSGNGSVRVANGKGAGFNLRVTGGPSATPTKKSSASASETPALGDETLAPPEAGGQVIVPSTEGATSRTSDSGGLSFGFWVGIVAIVGALGLVGSLFYFRRKDRQEPDTGMHPVVPGPGGGYGPAQPTTYGSPAAPTTYGSPHGSFPPPVDPYQQGGATQIINPGGPGQPPPGNDQTVTFRRPEQY